VTEPVEAAAAAVDASAARPASGGTLARLRDYLSLTKPRVMTLLLLTGFCALVAGARGLPSWRVTTASMVGLALACGGASALNHALEADIDRLMGPRTRDRPVAAARLRRVDAVRFGLALTIASAALLAAVVNLLAAALALAGNLFYVVIYTRWLKRSTPQNIVIGGAAGAIPPLVGWAAATGRLGLAALFLSATVFLWTPPHFWALALLLERDYRAAGIPMLPVVRGERETSRQILRYSLALVALTVAPFAVGSLGLGYLVAALVLGGVFVVLAARLRRRTTARAAALLLSLLASLPDAALRRRRPRPGLRLMPAPLHAGRRQHPHRSAQGDVSHLHDLVISRLAGETPTSNTKEDA
jgi:protoheme IX farnesyltransferase